MNDRYLFKAKRVDNGEWEIGSLIALPTGEYEISNKCNNPPDCDPMWDKVVITHKVGPFTICQCTGLKDKNGKLIWENDIVKTQYGKAVVVWDKSEWRIKWIDDLIWRRDLHYWANDNSWRIEVIGNRFDNHKLLEREE